MGCQALGEIQIISRSGCECYNSRIIPGFENKECLHRATMGMLRRQMGSSSMGRKGRVWTVGNIL